MIYLFTHIWLFLNGKCKGNIYIYHTWLAWAIELPKKRLKMWYREMASQYLSRVWYATSCSWEPTGTLRWRQVATIGPSSARLVGRRGGGDMGITCVCKPCKPVKTEHERKPRGQGPSWNSIPPIAVLFLFRGGSCCKVLLKSSGSQFKIKKGTSGLRHVRLC